MKSRAQRRADKERVIKKRLRLVKSKDSNTLKVITGQSNYENTLEVSNSLGKQHPFDCGTPNCLCCHYEKVLKKKRLRDLKVAKMMEEQLGEL